MTADRARQMAELLAAGWAGRSTAEVNSFRGRLSRSATSGREEFTEADTVREIAALSGSVAPRDLTAGLDPVTGDRVLDTVIDDFDRTTDQRGEWRWTLRSGPRRATLRRLRADARVGDTLAATRRVPTDRPGRLLRAVAGGASIWGSDERTVAPDVITQALVWALPLGGYRADLAEARRRSQLQAVIDSYLPLTEHGVFGRAAAISRLEEFATADSDPGDAAPILPVLGVGGAGKSTLLAAFLLPVLAAAMDGTDTGPICVVIDFDRAMLRARDYLALSFEVTRQLGCAVPAAGADFSALRYQSRDDAMVVGFEQYGSDIGDSGARQALEQFHMAAVGAVRRHGLDVRVVVLVLDTYEELQRIRPIATAPHTEWNDPDRRLLEWVDALRDEMGLHQLRVVVSGRSTIGDATDSDRLKQRLALAIRADDLNPADAAALLAADGVPVDATPRLAAIAGGNSLTLRVTARFYRRLGKAARRRFLAGQVEDDLTEEVRRAVLYKRFLEHIDETVRPLAHPGLALRRVTPDLIQYVLAPHCGLGEIDHWRAERLTDILADEVWLVRRGAGDLRHHAEVRRPMLAMMADDPRWRDTIPAIHRAAVDWYRSGRDSGLDAERAAMEADYHELMVSPELELPSDEAARWERLAEHLGVAVDELPPRIGAQLRLYLDGRIEDTDGLRLPTDRWRDWIEKRGVELIASDDPTTALDLLTARGDTTTATWFAEAMANACRWHEYWTSHRTELQTLSSRFVGVNAVVAGPAATTQFIDSLRSELAGAWPSTGAVIDRLCGIL